MSYKEAKALLETLPNNPYLYNGDKWIAKIIPETVKDSVTFIVDLQNKKAVDSDVVKYSSNNQFTVNGYMMKSFKF